MLLSIHPESPEERKIEQVAACLEKGGVVVYPTDTIYGIGCDITNHEAMQKVLRFKDINLRKTSLTMMCADLSQMAEYVRPLSSRTFKLIKKNTPGPFTFILEASNNVPKLFKSSKKTIGVRVPNNEVVRAIVRQLGRPILSTSVKDDNEDAEEEFFTDASLIQERMRGLADIVIDGGPGLLEGSTIVDCTTDDWTIVRQGLGELDDNI